MNIPIVSHSTGLSGPVRSSVLGYPLPFHSVLLLGKRLQRMFLGCAFNVRPVSIRQGQQVVGGVCGVMGRLPHLHASFDIKSKNNRWLFCAAGWLAQNAARRPLRRLSIRPVFVCFLLFFSVSLFLLLLLYIDIIQRPIRLIICIICNQS